MNKPFPAMVRACALSSIALAAGVRADPGTQLPVQHVDAPRIHSSTLPDIEGARAIMSLTPGGANVIDSETFRDARVSTLQDALGYSAGVFVQPRFGSEESRLSI
ncbi:MAG TPA: Plug domain-containing protein, partial [Methyloversatilis sp.]